MHIHQALADLNVIKSSFLQTQRFRLLRATIVSCTGLLGMSAALLQPHFLSIDEITPAGFCGYWSIVAAIATVITLAGVAARYVRTSSEWDRRLWSEAAWLFVPSLVVGGIVTFIAARQQNLLAVYLPGFWMLFFGLGVWSAARLFSRAMVFVALYYFIAGAVTLLLCEIFPFSPAFMFWGFGVGQFLMSGVIAYDEKTDS